MFFGQCNFVGILLSDVLVVLFVPRVADGLVHEGGDDVRQLGRREDIDMCVAVIKKKLRQR